MVEQGSSGRHYTENCYNTTFDEWRGDMIIPFFWERVPHISLATQEDQVCITDPLLPIIADCSTLWTQSKPGQSNSSPRKLE